MTLDSTEVRSFASGSNGHVYAAPVGTVEPADISEAVSGSWTELGHISDAGPRFSFGKNRTPVQSWQSHPDPVRTLKDAAVTTISYDLLQWNAHNVALAVGGGSWTEDSSGIWTFTPADADHTVEQALIIEGQDGDAEKWRFIFRRTENQAAVDFAWTGTALSPLPIQSTVLTPDGTERFIIQTNSAAISALSL